MNREDIIRMAREAGYFLYDLTETHGIKTVETDEDDQWAQLERFAAIVAARERKVLMGLLQKQADLAVDALDRRWALEMIAAVAATGETK